MSLQVKKKAYSRAGRPKTMAVAPNLDSKVRRGQLRFKQGGQRIGEGVSLTARQTRTLALLARI